MASHRRHALLALTGTGGLALINLTHAESIDQYFARAAPLYELGRSDDILQRPHTEYDPLGIHAGGFVIRPSIEQAVGYDSNVLGARPAAGSWVVGNAPQIDIASDFGRDAVTASFGLDDQRDLGQKRQSRTDWNASATAGVEIGRDLLNLSASERYRHVQPTDIDSATAQPLGYKLTDLRARYTTALLEWQFEPAIEYVGYRFDDLTVPGTPLAQKFNDRDIYVGGLTARYGNWPDRSLVAVLRATGTRYVAALGGAARPDSIGYEALVGADYAASGALRGLLLVGYEVRRFASGAYADQATPVAEASLVWSPSGVTTVVARASRTIEDSLGETTTSLTQTEADVRVTHEYLRNVLLEGRGSVIHADYNQGQGHETLYGVGASVSYLIDRNLRLTVSYDLTERAGSAPARLAVAAGSTSLFGDYTRQVALARLRFAL